MIITQNRKFAFYLGLIASIFSWYTLLLMTQTKNIVITQNQYIGLGFAIAAYTLWWIKICYTLEV
jgi:hypothetical protein